MLLFSIAKGSAPEQGAEVILGMIVFFYGAIILAALFLLYLAAAQESFPLAYLGMALILITGLMLWSEGVEVYSGVTIDDSVTPAVVNYTYTTHTHDGNWVVAAFANAFFFGGLGLMVGTGFFAGRS